MLLVCCYNHIMEKIDFLAIGDTVIDAFIKLKDATVHGEPDTKGYELCLPFADKVPYEEIYVMNAVGNAANAAVSAARLGLKSSIVTNIGNDQNGKDCLDSLENDGVNTGFVKVNNGKKTNYHYVLWYQAERTILIKHEEYQYNLPDIGTPKCIYFSSVNERAFPFHYIVADYLEAHPEIKFAFQPGKFEIKLGKEKLARLYQKTEIFFCNVEEAEKILGKETTDIKELLAGISSLGPKMVVITDGPRGAYAYDRENYFSMPIYPDPKPPYERTGAGDAFSSTVVAALALEKNLSEALSWGPINSMSVVQEVGAQKGLLSREKLEEYLKNAPADYKAKETN